MDSAGERLTVYRELAEQYQRLGQSSQRDRFLMLAADAALEAGRDDEAERLRQHLLAGSRHHMLRPFASFAEASHSPDVETYLRDLRTNYPLEQAHVLLDSLRGGGTQTPRAIPPTAPLLDINAPVALARQEGLAPVYSLRDEDPAPPPRPRAQPVPRPRAAPAPVPLPVREPEPLPVAAAIPSPGSPARGGAWFSTALLIVAASMGVVLAAFALVRPFLPAGWLP